MGWGSALFCVSLSAKNRMVQAPKSWYNRYKSYGAPGQKACAKTLPFREIVPAKYVTLFHIIPVPQARRHYMILYLYAPRRNHTILYLHAARHFLAKTIRFCTFTNSLPPVDFVPETTDLPDEYRSFAKRKKQATHPCRTPHASSPILHPIGDVECGGTGEKAQDFLQGGSRVNGRFIVHIFRGFPL